MAWSRPHRLLAATTLCLGGLTSPVLADELVDRGPALELTQLVSPAPPTASIPAPPQVPNLTLPPTVAVPATPISDCLPTCLPCEADDSNFVRAWGWAGIAGYYTGERMAPNGYLFDPLFNIDLDFNFWIWRKYGVYGFIDNTFWAQRAAPGITNKSQGSFDFSKREFDFDLGLAWNYWENWEARVYAYSFNNLNRGASLVRPYGYKDGMAIEQRWYLRPIYRLLGTRDYDILRSDYVSVGYMPSKGLVGGAGEEYKPGVYLHGYLTQNLGTPKLYGFVEGHLQAERYASFRQFDLDLGLAFRPFTDCQHFEFRAGGDFTWDWDDNTNQRLGYLAMRLVF